MLVPHPYFRCYQKPLKFKKSNILLACECRYSTLKITFSLHHKVNSIYKKERRRKNNNNNSSSSIKTTITIIIIVIKGKEIWIHSLLLSYRLFTRFPTRYFWWSIAEYVSEHTKIEINCRQVWMNFWCFTN